MPNNNTNKTEKSCHESPSSLVVRAPTQILLTFDAILRHFFALLSRRKRSRHIRIVPKPFGLLIFLSNISVRALCSYYAR